MGSMPDFMRSAHKAKLIFGRPSRVVTISRCWTSSVLTALAERSEVTVA